MDSRLIHKASEKLQGNITWKNEGVGEFMYCGSANDVRWGFVEKILFAFFDSEDFYVAVSRASSFLAEKRCLMEKIHGLVGETNFLIWDMNFKKAVEFNHIGVFRQGELL